MLRANEGLCLKINLHPDFTCLKEKAIWSLDVIICRSWMWLYVEVNSKWMNQTIAPVLNIWMLATFYTCWKCHNLNWFKTCCPRDDWTFQSPPDTHFTKVCVFQPKHIVPTCFIHQRTQGPIVGLSSNIFESLSNPFDTWWEIYTFSHLHCQGERTGKLHPI